jgi:hypothetical protein
MDHTIEEATSGRSKCRGCGRTIAKDELRFGERLPNPFADGTVMTHWFHPVCAAMKRPGVFIEYMDASDFARTDVDTETLLGIARLGVQHRRLPRIDGAERSPSGRATCRHCRELIEKDVWRIRLVFYEEGMFNPAGFVHLSCVSGYVETDEVLDRIAHFSPDLTVNDRRTLADLIASSA